MNISGHMKNLLLLNEQVILPGFGEFITSAAENQGDSLGTIVPPAKTLRFNAAAKANDYVLARYVAERENVSVSDGNKAIREFVDELAHQFDEFREIKIAGIGSFFLEEEGGALRFSADPNINFHPDAFGLGSVQIGRGPIPVAEENRTAPADENMPDDRNVPDEGPGNESQEAAVTSDEEPIYTESDAGGNGTEKTGMPRAESDSPPPPRRRKLLYIVLIILIALFTVTWALCYLYPDQTREYVNQVREKSNIWFGEGNDITPEPVVIETPTSRKDGVKEPHQEPSGGEESEPQDETTASPGIKPPVATPTTGRFVINAGAFSSRTNAEKMVERLRSEGFHAATLDGQTGTGLWRVTAGFFPTEENALDALRRARAENKLPNAWVSERKI
jgi:cell division septation protein DedD